MQTIAPTYKVPKRLFQLLLWSQLVGVSTLSLSAVGGSRWQSSVAFAANGLLTVVLRSQGFQGWFNHLDV